ncbi:MAG TPA: GNAT family N-acetyltransferase [Stellaceae bacterium]|nr:GNAT family N-acetyltransferase [Stellaceae bacterium]
MSGTAGFDIRLFDDSATFQRDVLPMLYADPIGNNLLLGAFGRSLAEDVPGWLAAAYEGGRPALALARFGGFPFSLSIGAAEAAEPLAQAAAVHLLDVQGVTGPAASAEPFAAAFGKATGRAITSRVATRLYALRAVIDPARPAAGRLRLASALEAGWISDWLVAFAVEAGLSPGERRHDHMQAAVARRIAARQQFIWEAAGRPVAIAAVVSIGVVGARIGGVYTLPDERGHGYASACVAALSHHVLDEGRAWCALFADAANPISNAIYQRLGYRANCLYRAFDFAAGSVGP